MMLLLSLKKQRCLHSWSSKLFCTVGKKVFPKRFLELVHNTGLEELWRWSFRVKAAVSAVHPVNGPALEEARPVSPFPWIRSSSQTEEGSSLPVQSSVFSDDSPGGSTFPVALGAKQRKPVDCAEALLWSL